MLDAAAATTLVAEHIAGLKLPALIGLNGAQGAGKSTLAKGIAADLGRRGLHCALLSLDDFYLTRAERERLAHEVHPLCATRGVPGTHDMELLEITLGALAAGGETALPVFDKLADDRLPHNQWRTVSGRPDAIVLEGWCVGLLSDDVPAWSEPINALEAECDSDGAWFAWSREALERAYDPLWRQLGQLVSIDVPGWETVIESRLRQERDAVATSGRRGMDRAQITRFAEHYERYTRALWAAMPERADMLLRRNEKFGYSLAQVPEL
jgi:D-glycerate 3-kinase